MNQTRKLLLCAAIAGVLVACGQGRDVPAGDIRVASGQAADQALADNNRSFRPLDRAAWATAEEVPCALDAVNEIPSATEVANLESGGEARFIGWVADSQLDVPPAFQLVLVGEASYAADGATGVERPDVAQALGSPVLASAGFDVVTTLPGVAPGSYAVELLLGDERQPRRCDTRTRVTVVAAPR